MANSFLFMMFLYRWLDPSGRAEKSYDSYIISCHVAYLRVYVLLFFCVPRCNFSVLWVITLTLHTFISHIQDDVEGDGLELEHICRVSSILF